MYFVWPCLTSSRAWVRWSTRSIHPTYSESCKQDPIKLFPVCAGWCLGVVRAPKFSSTSEWGRTKLPKERSEGTCHLLLHGSSLMLLGQWKQQARRRRFFRASSNNEDCCHGNNSYVGEGERGTSCDWVIVSLPYFQWNCSNTGSCCCARRTKGQMPLYQNCHPGSSAHGLWVPVTPLQTQDPPTPH